MNQHMQTSMHISTYNLVNIELSQHVNGFACKGSTCECVHAMACKHVQTCMYECMHLRAIENEHMRQKFLVKHVCVHIRACMHVYMYTCTYWYIYMIICMPVCVWNVCICAGMKVCSHFYTRSFLFLQYVCMQVLMYICMYPGVHVCTSVPMSL